MFGRFQAADALAVLALAMGVGAGAAGASAAIGYLRRAGPYPTASRLLVISEDTPAAGPLRDSLGASFRGFAAWTQLPNCLTAMTWSRPLGVTTLALPGGSVAARVAAVAPNLFTVLGTRFALGKSPGPTDSTEGAPEVVVSHRFWVENLGMNPRATARVLDVMGLPRRVVAVLPADFTFPGDLDLGVQLAGGTGRTDLMIPWGDYIPPPGSHGDFPLLVLGEMGARCNAAQVASDLSPAERSASRAFPSVAPLSLRVRPLPAVITAPFRPALVGLGAGTLLLFLIAAINFAGFVFAGIAARRRELALRAALGAGRLRLMLRALNHAVPVAALGLVAGTLAAWIAIVRQTPDTWLPGLSDIAGGFRPGLNLWVIAGAAGCVSALALVAAALGAARAFNLAAVDLAGSRTSHGLPRAAAWVLVGQSAVAFLLVTSAALLLATLGRERTVGLGFHAPGVVAVEIAAPGSDLHLRGNFYRELLASLRARPGIAAAAMASDLPLAGYGRMNPFTTSSGTGNAAYRRVTAGYFDVLGIPILAGQSVRLAGAAAIVSELVARRWWRGENPLGGRFHAGEASDPAYEVAAVAGDVREAGLLLGPTPVVYLPLLAYPPPEAYILLRSNLSPTAARQACTDLIANSRGAGLPPAIMGAETLSHYVEAKTAPVQHALLFAGVCGLAALLACLLGLLATTRGWAILHSAELATRAALGARPRSLVALAVRRGIAPAGWGVALGAVLAPAALRVVSPAVWLQPAMVILTLALSGFAILLLAAAVAGAVAAAYAKLPLAALLRS